MTNPKSINDMSPAELALALAAAQAKIEALQKAGQRKLTLKVTARKADGSGTDGAISLYGMGKFPVTLYAAQWERILASAEEIEAFIAANAAIISRKE